VQGLLTVLYKYRALLDVFLQSFVFDYRRHIGSHLHFSVNPNYIVLTIAVQIDRHARVNPPE